MRLQAFTVRAVAVLSIMLLAGGAREALSQPPGARPAGPPGEGALPLPLVFREAWKQPPYAGKLNDVNRRITQDAVTNANLQLHLYGDDAREIEVAMHEGRLDLWSGFTKSPVAVTLGDRSGYFDLTGRARLRWMTRTEDLHVLHPVVKLADGTLLAGSRIIASSQSMMAAGDFEISEVTFDDQRWFKLDPVRVVTTREVVNPDLSRVAEIGYVDLAPGGGHGSAGCTNVSWIELYATTHER
jgi:hypothetical protein